MTRLGAWLGERWRWLRAAVAELPRPTPVQWLRASPFLLFGLALVVIVGRNLDTVDFPHYDAPEGFVPAPPPTTAAPGAERPALLAVAGATTSTAPANVGTARLRGTVNGPLGRVPGAVVRIERSIGDEVQVLDVVTDAAGVWDAPGIGGGRYRVRAFLPPTLAQRTAEVFLLRAGDEATYDLAVDEFGRPSAALAAAPAPALVDQQVNVAVLVSARVVDGDGFVSVQGIAGATVEVTSTSAWQRATAPGALLTRPDGQVVVTFTCRQVGAVQVQAVVRPPAASEAVITSASFDCIDPASLATTTAPPTGVEGPGNTTTSTTAP